MAPHPPLRMHGRGGGGDQRVAPGTARRAWGLARPWTRWLVAFLCTVVVGSALGAVPPLLVRRVLDDAIPAGCSWFAELVERRLPAA